MFILFSLLLGVAGPTRYEAIILGTGPHGNGQGVAIDNGIVYGTSYSKRQANVFEPGIFGRDAAFRSLMPPGADWAYLRGAGGGQVVIEAAFGERAVGFLRTADGKWVELGSGRWTSPSDCDGVSQVGDILSDFSNQGMLWKGSRESGIDLTPPTDKNSSVFGVDGEYQVGRTKKGAILWNSSPTKYKILGIPRGFSFAYAVDVKNGVQVGYGEAPDYYEHALLWRGTAESVVDLNPPGSLDSQALGTNGAQQVGYASVGKQGPSGRFNAAVWSGTRESYLNLHKFLPTEVAGNSMSQANGIDEAGNIAGTVTLYPDGFGKRDVQMAVLWRPLRP